MCVSEGERECEREYLRMHRSTQVVFFASDYLNGTGRTVLTVQTPPKKQYISLELGPVDVAGSEAYSLTVSPDEQTVKIVGKNSSGDYFLLS